MSGEKLRDLLYSAGGRKFVIGLIGAFWFKTIDSALLWFGKVNQDIYKALNWDLMLLLLGLFVANVASKYMDRYKPGGGDE